MMTSFSTPTARPILMLGWSFYGSNTLSGIRLMRSSDARAAQSAYVNSIDMAENMRLSCQDVGISVIQPDGTLVDMLELIDYPKLENEVCLVRKRDTYKPLSYTKIDVFTYIKENNQYTLLKRECRERDNVSIKGGFSLYQ